MNHAVLTEEEMGPVMLCAALLRATDTKATFVLRCTGQVGTRTVVFPFSKRAKGSE